MWLCSVDGLQFSTRWAYHKSSGGTNSNSNSLVERVWRKNKFGPSIEYQKINFNYSTGQVRVYLKLYQKALASLARWSIDTRVLNMCLLQHQQFFSIFIIWGAQNQSTSSLRLRSTTANLIPTVLRRVLRSKYPYSRVGSKYPFHPTIVAGDNRQSVFWQDQHACCIHRMSWKLWNSIIWVDDLAVCGN